MVYLIAWQVSYLGRIYYDCEWNQDTVDNLGTLYPFSYAQPII